MKRSSKIIVFLIVLYSLFALLACDTDNIPSLAPGGFSTEYTVAFNSQFHDMESDTVMPNPTSKTVSPPATTVDSLPTPPSMSGYTFGGWWTGKNGTGIPFTTATNVFSDRVVYAYWFNYRVIFYNEGSLYYWKAVTLPATTISSLPTQPTRSGYTFAGWWTQPDGSGTEFVVGTPVTETIDVYAKWTSNEVRTITFRDRQKIFAKQHVTDPFTLVGTGSDLPIPDQPCREFQGWWTEENGGGTQFLDNTVVGGSNVNVYAKWSTNDVRTITYNSGRGTVAASQCVTEPDFTLESLGKTIPSPLKRCYAFDGWWTDEYGEGDSFNATTPVAEDMTVYANWTWTPTFPTGPFAVGDFGPSCIGKVFYVTDGGQHGLEMAPPGWYDWYDEDPDPSHPWISADPIDEFDQELVWITRNGNTATDVGTGMANSLAIIAQAEDSGGDKPYAAKLCINYSVGDFDDWFLPSRDELDLLFQNRDVKKSGGFADGRGYWSSSEFERGEFDAWSHNFTNGKQTGTYKSNNRMARPVRAF